MYYSTLYKEKNMARGGINKTLIKEARQELLRKGINPSLDSIRVQLGNTGSKSTIHRYLKEIEEQEAVQLNDEDLLNNTLKEMISRLASQLNADANEIVEKNEEESSKKINQLNDDLNTFKKQLTHAETQIELLETKLLEKDELIAQQQYKIQNQQLESTESHEKINQLIDRIKDKDNYLASLEEKNNHSRDALEHYRQSVKEQRQQDIRLHEQHIQQLQVEQRNLNQTLAVKQEDIARLNADNSRLVTELKGSGNENIKIEKSLAKTKQSLELVSKDVSLFKDQVDLLSGQIEDKDSQIMSLKDEAQLQISNSKQLEQDLLTAKVELRAKTDIFNEFSAKLNIKNE